eukprot:2042908-Rhodomonas_salina.1
MLQRIRLLQLISPPPPQCYWLVRSEFGAQAFGACGSRFRAEGVRSEAWGRGPGGPVWVSGVGSQVELLEPRFSGLGVGCGEGPALVVGGQSAALAPAAPAPGTNVPEFSTLWPRTSRFQWYRRTPNQHLFGSNKPISAQFRYNFQHSSTNWTAIVVRGLCLGRSAPAAQARTTHGIASQQRFRVSGFKCRVSGRAVPCNRTALSPSRGGLRTPALPPPPSIIRYVSTGHRVASA